MQRIVLLPFVIAASSASAQPITAPTACTVSIVRAPDDVRATVEAWVGAEPRCNTALELRIVPTEGGLYLLAIDDRGRIRERIVPDATSAGVLVSSWAADDTMYVPPPPVQAPAPPPPPPVQQPAPQYESLMPPGEPAPVVMPRSTKHQLSKWISAGLLLEPANDGGGLRADADLYTRQRYSLGLAISSTVIEIPLASGEGELTVRDIKLMATAAHTWQSGRWFLRAALGVGAVKSKASALLSSYGGPYTFIDGEGWFVTGELGGSAGLELGRNWALHVGPSLSIHSQRYEEEPSYYPMSTSPQTLERNGVDLMLLTGLKYRL